MPTASFGLHGDMEIIENSVSVKNQTIDFISIKHAHDKPEADLNENKITAAEHFCTIEIEEKNNCDINNKNNMTNADNKNYIQNEEKKSNVFDSNLNDIQHAESCTIANALTAPIYLDTFNSDSINADFQKQTNITNVFIKNNEQMGMTNISTVTISNELLDGLNFNVKKEDNIDDSIVYTGEWLCNSNNHTSIRLRVLKNTKENVQIPIHVETDTTPVIKHKEQLTDNKDTLEQNKTKIPKRSKKRTKLKSTIHQEYRERLRKKAECMREKRKKLYEQETEEQRLQRLAKEAAKRREMRMYYETPEQKRKRLDAEAARKREYRMYNETPQDRRKRLDREAERRRIKRSSLYASETAEQRRDRLNKESAKRREARLNQYAKETEEERKERLRRDALRAKEMRFTRSAIETEEERKQRLVKDSRRKREVRMHGSHSVTNNFTELQTVQNSQELNDTQIRNDPENHLDGHYLSNWMMWFQNTLTQPIHMGEHNMESQPQHSS